MTNYERRICRSLVEDETVNTIELYPGPTFGIMEFLDHKDSRYFAKYVTKKGWQEITPDEHKQQQTYYKIRPPDAQLKAFENIEPDWFYISGHYARTPCASGIEGASNYPLPAGFFNEPFHDHEWITEWNLTDDKSLFVQTEKLDGSREKEFRDVMNKVWLRSPYTSEKAHKDKTASDVGKAEVIKAWSDVWKRSADDVKLGNNTCPGIRGILTEKIWTKVKVVMLVGCNTLAWPKGLFNDAFPNALILGYTNKNPANGTPHIKAFLKNLFKDISSTKDPRIFDHDYIANAWMEVHRKQRLTKSARMCYMTTDGKVFAFDKKREVTEAGGPDDVMVRYDDGSWIKAKDFFALKGFEPIRADT